MENCFLSDSDMKKLRSAAEYVRQAIDRCEKKGRAALENDPGYKGFYPTVLSLQEKCADILDCFIKAGAISIVHGDHRFDIVSMDQEPKGIRIHLWIPSEANSVKPPEA